MSYFFLAIWIGGISTAYRLNRKYGEGRISSAVEAFAWPCGLGFYLASKFYVNSDWPESARHALDEKGTG